MKIRAEKPADYKEVEELVRIAFLSAEHSDKDEHNLVARIRKGENYIPELSMVAEKEDKLLGHIMLSKIKIKNDKNSIISLALAPLSVLPEYQKQGIGSALMNEVIKKAKDMGYSSIVILGYPTYYSKFGFSKAKGFNVEFGTPDMEDYFMLMKLDEEIDDISGKIIYSKEFMLNG